MGPWGIPRILLGVQVLLGFWHYEYMAAAIDDFAGINLHRNAPASDVHVRIHRIRAVYHNEAEDCDFPTEHDTTMTTIHSNEFHNGLHQTVLLSLVHRSSWDHIHTPTQR